MLINNDHLIYHICIPVLPAVYQITGSVPTTWLSAIVTPISKIPKMLTPSDFRPISVTPILSIVLQKHLSCQIGLEQPFTPNIINYQFAFRPTGSITYALTYFMHHVCKFLETNDYVRVLLIDFSMVFDVVNHVILIKNILALDMPANINNWLLLFFTGYTGL